MHWSLNSVLLPPKSFTSTKFSTSWQSDTNTRKEKQKKAPSMMLFDHLETQSLVSQRNSALPGMIDSLKH